MALQHVDLFGDGNRRHERFSVMLKNVILILQMVRQHVQLFGNGNRRHERFSVVLMNVILILQMARQYVELFGNGNRRLRQIRDERVAGLGNRRICRLQTSQRPK